MTKKGLVTRISGDTVYISVKRECACAGARPSFGKRCESSCFAPQSNIIKTPVKDGGFKLKPGDIVELGTETKLVLMSSVFVFILPLITAISAYYTASYFSSAVLWPYISAGAGFFISVFVVFRLTECFLRKSDRVMIIRKLD